MRKWGVIITLFYVAVLAVVILPLAIILAGGTMSTVLWEWYPWPWTSGDFLQMPSDSEDFIILILYALWFLILIAGQAILLFVSVDTSFKRLKPRRHILVSIATVFTLVALLTAAVVMSIDEAIVGYRDWTIYVLWAVVPFWLVWGLVFYRYKAGIPDKLRNMTGWLLKGSILELLIVVPCHIIVRQRGDCSAPGVTAFGIATGIAIMLLSFGPSVFFLYQKRLAEYARRKAPEGP